MLFSKSFGYALRGVLYIAATQQDDRLVPADDIALELGVPKYFMAKILKTLVKEGFLASVKGPRRGFSVLPEVLSSPLIDLLAITDGLELFQSCVLRLKACDPENPCPLHVHFLGVQRSVREILKVQSIGSFLETGKEVLLRSLSADSPDTLSEILLPKY
jgi:Rrf2 family iron-sulfur cluster assembly transcriptional regulator